MSSPRESDRRALDNVVERATVDRLFRQQLLIDPRNAIHDALGVTIPAHFRIRFIERGPDLDALVVLPDFKGPGDELSGNELSDNELEAVSGGALYHASWSDPPSEPSVDHADVGRHYRRAGRGRGVSDG
jgi:hypothetical protein